MRREDCQPYFSGIKSQSSIETNTTKSIQPLGTDAMFQSGLS